MVAQRYAGCCGDCRARCRLREWRIDVWADLARLSTAARPSYDYAYSGCVCSERRPYRYGVAPAVSRSVQANDAVVPMFTRWLRRTCGSRVAVQPGHARVAAGAFGPARDSSRGAGDSRDARCGSGGVRTIAASAFAYTGWKWRAAHRGATGKLHSESKPSGPPSHHMFRR